MPAVSQEFQRAVALHRAGQIEEAARLYDAVLRIDPRHADALHLRGVAAHQQSQHAEGVEFIRRAIALSGRQAAYYSNLGAAYRALGLANEAVSSLRRATMLAPDQPEFQFNLANALRQAGEFDEAIRVFQRAISIRPDYAEAFNNLGTLFRERGRVNEATAYFERAIQIDPRRVDALLNLADVRRTDGRCDEAAKYCRRALEMDPKSAAAYNVLGLINQQSGRLDDAVRAYRRAADLHPRNLDVLNNLAVALVDMQRSEEAIAIVNEALALLPTSLELRLTFATALKSAGRIDEAADCLTTILRDHGNHATAWNNLGNVQKELGQIDKAIQSYRCAIVAAPESIEAHNNIAALLHNEGDCATAQAHYEVAIRNGSSQARIRRATLLPPIYSSLEEMHRWRNRLRENVSELVSQHVAIDTAREIAETTFYLPYQGCNDRELQLLIARLHRSSRAELHGRLTTRVRSAGKTRVGFISRYFCNHTIGRLYRGLIEKLSRTEFDVFVISTGRHNDEISKRIRASTDRYIELPQRIPDACDALDQLELDVLLFTDIGMDPLTYTLAHSRFAPVQCAMWGHPITTGLDTIDYFLSSKLFEVDDPHDHYSERLVRFESPGVYYFRPDEPGITRKSDFGLPDGCHLYGCPQSLFKIHPEFDAIIGEILRRDPRGEVVLLDGSRPNWNRLLLERFAHTIPDVIDRVRFVGRQSYVRFLQLNTVFDVLLDPIHFGGGNTSYEAFAAGIPLVTWPSEFLRGRITHGLYRRMRIADCVAASHADYIAIALRLANDIDYRTHICNRILAAAPSLFEDRAAILELENFLRSAATEHNARQL